ncbi:MAG: metal/formaldehyde-sensitive transcriptional repressor [Betaproteobacteria bacterium]|nr:metal/formaldehyde-sensitive transcriptional repressor [Betaproteobacteria bacterium]
MSHTVHEKKKLLIRVRRIKGQVEAMEKALNEESDCAAVLQQIASIRGAVNGLMAEMLEGHIREHLGTEVVLPEQRQQDLEQVISVLRSYLK